MEEERDDEVSRGLLDIMAHETMKESSMDNITPAELFAAVQTIMKWEHAEPLRRINIFSRDNGVEVFALQEVPGQITTGFSIQEPDLIKALWMMGDSIESAELKAW